MFDSQKKALSTWQKVFEGYGDRISSIVKLFASERKIKNLDIIHLIEIINGINQDYKEQLDKMGDKLKAELDGLKDLE